MSVTHLPGTYAAAAAATLGALTGCSASGADLRTAIEAVCDGDSIAGEGDDLACEVDGAEVEGTTYAEDPSDDLDYWITDVVQSVVDFDDRTGVLQPLEDEGFEVGLDDPVGVPS